MVRNDAAVTEYIENKYKVKRGKARRKNFDSARFFGFIDGKNTEIHKQVSAGAKSQADGVKLLK